VSTELSFGRVNGALASASVRALATSESGERVTGERAAGKQAAVVGGRPAIDRGRALGLRRYAPYQP
jgi:hypothetical protein